MNNFVIDFKNNQKAAQVLFNCLDFIKKLPKEKKWEIVIKPYRFKRTTSQNSYLWGVVYQTIAENEGGYFLNEVTEPLIRKAKKKPSEFIHEYFKQEYLTIGKVGEKSITRSTTDLNTKEFTEYVEKIMRFASTVLGVYIPTPEERGLSDYQKWWGK